MKKREHPVEEHGAWFRDLFEKSPDPCWIIDENNLFVLCNNAAVDILGYDSAEELTSTHPSKLSPVTQPDGRDSLEKANAMMATAQEKGIHRFEWEHKRKSGECFPVEVTLSSISLNGKDCIYCVWKDISDRNEVIRELQRSRERFKLAMAGATDGLWDWNLETDEVYYSPRWMEMLGYEANELEHRIDTWATLVHPDDKDWVLQRVTDYLENRADSFDVEIRMQHKDGHNIIVLSRAIKATNPDSGKPNRLVGTHVDITERKKAEEQLLSAARFREHLLYQASEGIVVWKLSHTENFAEFIVWNRRMEQMTGYSQAEINTVGWLNAIYNNDDQRELARSTMLKVIHGETNHGRDFKGITKSGEERIFHISSSPIRGENDEPCVLAIVEDVTETRSKQAELEQSQKRFQTLFNSSTDGIFILDLKGNFIDINRTAHERLGYSRDEMLASSVSELDPPEFREKVPKRMRQIMESGQTVFESAHFRKDGSIMPVEINARLLELEGKQIVMSIVRDISERKALEEQLRHSQKMESIGTLVGGIAHDFNNMLAAVQGNIYLAKRLIQEHPLAEDKLDNIEKLSARGADMVQQLLTFARKDIVQMKVFNLNSFMDEGYALAKAVIPENIDHQTTICEEQLNIKGDATQLQQVMFNLLNNAVDAVAEAPQPKIRCSLDRYDSDQPFLLTHPDVEGSEFARITVKDNGHGIPSEHKNQIFEPFFTTKEVGKGTGLGLSMLYGAVQTHGGAVEVESEPGGGTAIHVYLPLSQEAPEIQVSQPSTVAKGEGLTILLVDDEKELRQTTAEVLHEMGYRVVEAEDGEEALNLFKARGQEIALILSDVIMPKMGGIQLLEAVRELDSDIPVILTTGYDESVMGKAFQPEHCEVVKKPFDPERLFNSIKVLTEKRTTS